MSKVVATYVGPKPCSADMMFCTVPGYILFCLMVARHGNVGAEKVWFLEVLDYRFSQSVNGIE